MRLVGVMVALVLGSAAPAFAGGAFVPPLRVDLGPALSGSERSVGGQVVLGIHWASLYPKTTYLDVGLGYSNTTFGGPEERANKTILHTEDPLTIHAGYLEVATRMAGNRWWRSWFGMRVEAGKASRNGRSQGMVGFATRMSAELWAGGSAGGSNALIMGVGAVGIYGELSARRLDDDDINDYGASVGLSFRVPLIAGN